jgi:hypothetical protein
MSNAIEFIKNITSDDISVIVTRFFDEIMVLYNFVGSRQDIDVCVDNGASLATFILLMDSEKEAIKLYNTLNNTYFSVYGDRFDINMQLKGESITTIITKASS